MGHAHAFARRGAALALAATLLLGVGAAAAEPEKTRSEARQEDLTFLYETLSTQHPGLFANTPEADFLARKAEIEARLDTVSDAEFVLDLQSLVALAGDSHTSAAIGRALADIRYFPVDISWMDGRWYLTAAERTHRALLGAEVTAVNGRSMEEVLAAFGRLFSADNPVRLRRQVDQSINVANLYEYLGLIPAGEPMVLTLSGKGADTLTLEPADETTLAAMDIAKLTDQRAAAAPTDADRSRIYFAKALDQNTYYIQYNACRQDPELPMEIFAAQVRADLDKGQYGRILVDLRNNGGGSDGVIWPLFEVLRSELDRGTEVVGLIGEATFSSAIINAVELQEMGAVLAGEPTGGSVSHFGSVNVFKLPNSGIQVQHSTKWIDLNTLLDAGAGRGVVPLTPDVEVPLTLADFLAGRDTCVEYLLSHKEPLAQTPFPDAPLTRGRFLGNLYEAAGAPAQAVEAPPFADSLGGIEWFTPALTWGKAQGIARGTGSDCFAAARYVTWQEAAVFLTRAAQALDLTPGTVRTAPLPAALAEGAWDLSALETVWAWGLLPEGADFTQPPTRAQGEAMAKGLLESGVAS